MAAQGHIRLCHRPGDGEAYDKVSIFYTSYQAVPAFASSANCNSLGGRYVEYAMHRVRMLRHYKVEPYIVFDGGPLSAKKGTESERKKKRDENLSKGKALVAQNKHSQARECFVKCVDVTPQMAYQLIKVR